MKGFKRLITMVMALSILFSMTSMCVSAQQTGEEPLPEETTPVVESIALEPLSLLENVEGTECWAEGASYMHYFWQDYLKGTVYFEDGTSAELDGAWFEYNGESFSVEGFDDQSIENPWSSGTYTVQVVFGEYSRDFQVEIVETPVDRVEIQPIQIIENTQGYLKEDNGAEYYFYYWYYEIEGTIFFKDGTTLDFNDTSFEYNDKWYHVEYSEGQDSENPWTVGNTYNNPVSLLGYDFVIPVEIVEIPVERIELQPLELIENTHGNVYSEWNEQTQEYDRDYFCYEWWYELSGTVYFKDETSVEFEGTSFEYNGEQCWIENSTTQGYGKQWTVGTYTETIRVLGYEQEVKIEIVESPIDRVEMESVELLDGESGGMTTDWIWDEGDESQTETPEYYQYYWWNYLYGTVYFDDGTTYELDGSDYLVYNGETIGFSYHNPQSYENQWTVGNTYTVTLSALGYSWDVSVAIESTPIENIILDPIELVKGQQGNTSTDWDEETQTFSPEYFRYNWTDHLSGTVYFKNGDSVTFDGISFEYDGDTYYFQCDDTQRYENAWTAGNTYTETVRVLGYEQEVEIQIADTPIQRIEIQIPDLIQNMDGDWCTDWDEETQTDSPEYFRYYWWTYLYGTVYFKDGSSAQISDTYFQYQGKDYWIDWMNTQSYENQWTVGTYTGTISVLGYTQELEVRVIATPIQSITIDPIIIQKDSYNFYTWDEDPAEEYLCYYYWELINGTVTFADGSTEQLQGNSLEYKGNYYSLEFEDGQSYENQWTSGNAYTVTAEVLNYEVSFTVQIVESLIDRMELDPVVVTMGTKGDLSWDYDEETQITSPGYFRYWCDASKVSGTVYFLDGTSAQITEGYFVYRGNEYWLTYNDTQSYEDQWLPGKTCYATVEAMGHTQQVAVSVVLPQAQALTLDVAESVTVTDNEEGVWYQFTPERTGKYIFTSAREDSADADPKAKLFTATGLFLGEDDDSNDDLNFLITAELTEGQTYYLWISTCGENPDTFSVTATSFFITDIEVEPIVIKEGTSGRFWNASADDGAERFYHYDWSQYIKAEITFKDGTTQTVDQTGFSYEGEYYYISTEDPQSDECPWLGGNTYETCLEIAGERFPVTVTIQETDIESIVLDPVNIAQESRGYWCGSGEDMHYHYDWSWDVSGTVYFKNGTSQTFHGCSFTYDGDKYILEYSDPQSCEEPMLPGNTYTVEMYVIDFVLEAEISILEVQESEGFGYIVQNGEVFIVDYVGESEEVAIPETIEDLPVTSVLSLGDEEWRITKLTIPDSVTRFSPVLFQERFGSVTELNIGAGLDADTVLTMLFGPWLEQVNISPDHQELCSIDGVVYDKAVTEILYYPYHKSDLHVIPDTVIDISVLIDSLSECGITVDFRLGTEVEGYVMENGVLYDSDRTTVYYTTSDTAGEYVMPQSVDWIYSYAFANSGFTKVTVAPSVTQIAYGAFEGAALQQIQLPENLEYISYNAFRGSALQSIAIPQSVTEIDSYAFHNCTQLERVDITDLGAWSNITFWGEEANPLNYAGDLYLNGTRIVDLDLTGVVTDMVYPNTFIGGNFNKVTVPSGVSVIGDSAFKGSSLTSVKLPEGLEYISSEAFCESGLTSVQLPDSLMMLSFRVFAGCKDLKTVDFGEGLSSISYEVFAQSGLESVTIPEQFSWIGYGAFMGCWELEEVIILSDELEIGYEAFLGCPIRELDLENVIYIEERAFESNQLVHVKIPESITDITYRSFAANETLQSVVIPESVETIFGFQDCPNIEHVVYTGSETQWGQIDNFCTDAFTDAVIHYNATGNEVSRTETRTHYRYTCALCDFEVSIEKKVPGTVLEITKQPEGVTALSGEYVTVSVAAAGDGLKYQWYYANKGATTFTKSTAATATTNTYLATMRSDNDGRRLYCVITDKYGQTVTTNTVTISIPAKPAITKQPVSVKALSGKSVSISVTATGEGLKYQWYYANKGVSTFAKSTIASATTAAYSVSMNSGNDGRRLYCVVTDKYGQKVTTNTVTISIPAKPAITKQPVSVKALSGKSVSISVSATGEGLKYQWYYANKGATTFSKSTATTATYYATMRSDNNGRRVYCVITDKYGQTVTTNTVTISIPAKPAITKQPVSVKALSGKSVSISVSATGEGLKYQWYYANKGATTFSKSTATTATYYATMRSDNNGRRVYCVITDKYGQKVTTNTVTLSIPAKPAITKQPVSVKALSGKSVSISVSATGEGLKYQWYYANKGATTFSKSTATTATYYATMRSDNNGRRIYCVITDKYGQKVTTNTVTISIPAKPAITKQPVSVKAASGAAVQVSVKATGEGLKYQWYYANKGATTFSKSTCTSSTYYATMRNDNNGRRLYCVITDKYGQTVKTVTVTLTMK